jgi:hypothetical protein
MWHCVDWHTGTNVSDGLAVSIFGVAFSWTIQKKQRKDSLKLRYLYTNVPVASYPRRLKSSTAPIWKPQIPQTISERSTVVPIIVKSLALCVDKALIFPVYHFPWRHWRQNSKFNKFSLKCRNKVQLHAIYETRFLNVHKYITNTVNPKEWMLLTF